MNLFHRTIARIKPTASDFAENDYAEGATSEEAFTVYVELRVRGFAKFESFVTAFGEYLSGHPDDIAECATALETTDAYSQKFKAVMREYSEEELRGMWDCFTTLPKARTSIATKEILSKIAARPKVEQEPVGQFHPLDLHNHAAAIRATKQAQIEANVNAYHSGTGMYIADKYGK